MGRRGGVPSSIPIAVAYQRLGSDGFPPWCFNDWSVGVSIIMMAGRVMIMIWIMIIIIIVTTFYI